LLLLSLLREYNEKIKDAENEYKRQQRPNKTAAAAGILKKK
jgi:hypothetical protein